LRVPTPPKPIPSPTSRTVLGKLEDLPPPPITMGMLDLKPAAMPPVQRTAPPRLPPPPFGFDEEEPVYSQNESSAGLICSVLSIVLGALGWLVFPLILCLAGLILGIIGAVLSRRRAAAITGIVISTVGFLAGIALLIVALNRGGFLD
jgi:hypothetical protein